MVFHAAGDRMGFAAGLGGGGREGSEQPPGGALKGRRFWGSSDVKGRGKLPRFTQACGNRRFMALAWLKAYRESKGR